MGSEQTCCSAFKTQVEKLYLGKFQNNTFLLFFSSQHISPVCFLFFFFFFSPGNDYSPNPAHTQLLSLHPFWPIRLAPELPGAALRMTSAQTFSASTPLLSHLQNGNKCALVRQTNPSRLASSPGASRALACSICLISKTQKTQKV